VSRVSQGLCTVVVPGWVAPSEVVSPLATLLPCPQPGAGGALVGTAGDDAVEALLCFGEEHQWPHDWWEPLATRGAHISAHVLAVTIGLGCLVGFLRVEPPPLPSDAADAYSVPVELVNGAGKQLVPAGSV
jgi:hypothetical protein